MASIDVKYEEELVKLMQNTFINKIVPETFLVLIHTINPKVLTMADIDRLKKRSKYDATIDVNYDLLVTLKNYDGWFNAILKVCRHKDVKQDYLAIEFEKIKSDLDKDRTSSETQVKGTGFNLEKLSLVEENDVEGDGREACGQAVARICESPENSKLSTGGDKKIEHQIPEDGYYMENGRGYCFLCYIELTSEKHKAEHISGKEHKKKQEKKRSLDETPIKRGSLASSDQVSVECSNLDGTEQCNLDKDRTSSEIQVKGTGFDLEKLSLVAENDVGGGGREACGQAVARICESPENSKLSTGGDKKIEHQIPEDGYYMENGRGYCFLCCIELTSEKHKAEHISGKEHKKQQEKRRSLDETSIKRGSVASSDQVSVECSNLDGAEQCTICNVAFTSHENALQHLNGTKHKNRVAALEAGKTANTDSGTVYDSNAYHTLNPDGTGGCKICDVIFTSYDNAKQHLDGARHKSKMAALKDNEHVKVTPNLGPSGEPYILNANGTGKCFVCDVALTSKEHATQHVDGRKHKNKCKEYGLK